MIPGTDNEAYWQTKSKSVLIKILLMQEEIIGNYEESMEKLREIIN